MKKISAISAAAAIISIFLASGSLRAQQVDSTSIYSDKTDSLSAAVATGSSGQGNYLSRFKDVRTEVISAAGLCKMACCNLAESFENSASVTVGYSDAVTGARQIRLLGLSGTYTQMLDENRPVMRGIASPFGLGYVPGQWLSSIQIAKGAPSVINGVESITGQINMEHRKPTDEIPLFVNAALMSEGKADLNIASSLQLDKEGKWSTAILGHVSGNFKGHDMNGDGFLDEPRAFQVNIANRWLYYAPSGLQVRFGLKLLRDTRKGGEYDPSDAGKSAAYDYDRYMTGSSSFWGSSILNQGINAYLKVGVPLNEDNTQNVAAVLDFNDYSMASTFGKSSYNGAQTSGFVNLLYQNQQSEMHHFTLGLSATLDRFNELIERKVMTQGWKNSEGISRIVTGGVFGEYTFHLEEKLTAIAGLRADAYKGDGLRLSPRVTLRYNPIEQIVLRLNGGRGLRYACPIVDNIGVMSTGKAFYSNHKSVDASSSPLFASHPLEDAWVLGGNVTYYLPIGVSDGAYVGFDYFRTQFKDQLIADYENIAGGIDFYMLDGKSFTNTYQVDFSVEPVKRFTLTATFRYTDAKLTMAGRGLRERPMTSRYKGVLNLQYATNLNKWIFDFTASVNGPCRLYDFMGGGLSPVYPLLYAQVTHRMKGCDIYIGGENLTNFRQSDVLLGSAISDPSRAVKVDPASSSFDASCIWGPLMGIKIYAGIRITIWKKG